MTNLDYFININPVIVKNNNLYYFVINNILGYNNNPAYSLFILINDKVMADDNFIGSFLLSLSNAATIDDVSRILANGIEGKFILGTDYFLSYSLWIYLLSYNNSYINSLVASENEYYYMLDYISSYYERINTDSYDYVIDTNIAYFYRYNLLKDFEFTLDELNNFAATFCQIILDETTLTDITDSKNLIYKYVLEYYAKGKTDDTSVILDLILGDSSILYPKSNGTGPCCVISGTNTSTPTVSSTIQNNLTSADIIDTTTCKEKYLEAIKLYLVKMLGDPEFYCDWFYVYSNIDKSVNTPNILLIDKLKKLFEEFKKLNYTLYWGDITSKCGCKYNDSKLLSKYNEKSRENYDVMDKYYEVLEIVEDCEIDKNKNKIKIYGENFGILLPYLYFITP